jgi:hypothetical protein
LSSPVQFPEMKKLILLAKNSAAAGAGCELQSAATLI